MDITDERAPIDVCDECGFRWDEYDDETAVNAVRLGGAFYQGILEGVDLELANTRPATDTWSILEYVDHVRQAFAIWRGRTEVRVGRDGASVPEYRGFQPDQTRFADVEATIAAMDVEAVAFFDLYRHLAPDEWALTSEARLGLVDQHWIVRHQLHEVLHHGHDLGRLRHRLSDGVAHQTGTIHQLNVSGGGVPKLSVTEAEVGFRGLAGDQQNDRVHHGRPFQAVCLYGLDVIEALRVEGHPIQPGSAGENVTVAGLDWASLRPGALVAIGDELLLELSSYATPCAKNAGWFTGGDFRRMDQDRHPGWSRLYGTVLHPGTVRTGDAVVVEPER
ncbi:MAG: MOSC domain-containing protein [Acidimicrobiales bacterium]|nr:MOSC domain-containing protein [Acidimicrobiales bacterium]